MSGDSRHYLLTTHNGTLHLDPATEACNIDDVPRHRRRRFASLQEAQASGLVRRRCQHCAIQVLPNPDGEPE